MLCHPFQKAGAYACIFRRALGGLAEHYRRCAKPDCAVFDKRFQHKVVFHNYCSAVCLTDESQNFCMSGLAEYDYLSFSFDLAEFVCFFDLPLKLEYNRGPQRSCRSVEALRVP